MKILFDTIDLKFIEDNLKMPFDGVTTNPSIIVSNKAGVKELYRLRALIGKEKELHVQLTETTYQKMIEEAYLITRLLGDNTFIKVPVSGDGLKVIQKLTEDNINVTATAILTAAQAVLCAKAGAKYVAPYVSRLDNISGDGAQLVADIAQLFKDGGYSTQILAASFKTAKSVMDCGLVGAHCVTVSPDIYEKLYNHPTTTYSIEKFDSDWLGYHKKPLSELIKEFEFEKNERKGTYDFESYEFENRK